MENCNGLPCPKYKNIIMAYKDKNWTAEIHSIYKMLLLMFQNGSYNNTHYVPKNSITDPCKHGRLGG